MQRDQLIAYARTVHRNVDLARNQVLSAIENDPHVQQLITQVCARPEVAGR